MPNWAKVYLGDSRAMTEVDDAGIDLVVTSPPYWQIKDYGVPGQIGYGQSLHEYLKDLYRTWRECFRVLREGARLCINIGDQFARASVYGRYKVIPLHAEFINQCESLGFDFLGAIIWQKKTTMNPSGGAVVMGSYPFPPNGIVEIDYEFIQIFKKPGQEQESLERDQGSLSTDQGGVEGVLRRALAFRRGPPGGARGHVSRGAAPAPDKNVHLRGRHGAGPLSGERHHGQGGAGFGPECRGL